MLTFRDVVIIAAVVVLALLFFRRQRPGCGCKKPADNAGAAAAAKGRSCGLLPCGGGGK